MVAKLLFLFSSLYVVLFFAAPPLAKSFVDSKLAEYNVSLKIKGLSVDVLSANARVSGLELTRFNNKILSFDRLDVSFGGFDLDKRQIELNSLLLEGLRLYVHRDEQKTFDLQKIFPQNKNSDKSEKPFYFKVGALNLVNANVKYIDDYFKKTVELKNADISLEGVSTLPFDAEKFSKIRAQGFINGSFFDVSANGRMLDLKSEAELTLKGVDISIANSFLPKDSPVQEVGGALSLNAKIAFEKPKKLLALIDANITDVSAKTAYASIKTDAIALKKVRVSLTERKIALASLKIDKAKIYGKNDKKPLGANSVEVVNIVVDQPKKTASLDSIAIEGMEANISKKKGIYNIAALLGEKKAPTKNGQAKSFDDAKGNGWSLQAGKAYANGSIFYEDDMFLGKKPYFVNVNSFNLEAKDITMPTERPVKLSLTAKTGATEARVAAEIDANNKKANGSFEVKNIDLSLADSLGLTPPKVRIFGGDASFGGIFEAGLKEGVYAFLDDGFLEARRFGIYTEKRNSRLISFETLSLNGVSTSFPTLNSTIKGAALSGFYANLKMDENKTLNLVKLFKYPESNKTVASNEATKAVVVKQKPSLTIEGLTLQGGAIDFEDRGVKNRFKTSLTDITGSIGALSFDQNRSAKIELRANSGGYGRMAIEGDVVPDKENFALKLKAATIDIPLEQFTPYSEKFIGYKIEGGNLGLNLDYTVMGRKIEASNKVSLFDFSLGDEVESPKAPKLPYKFAIAVLKDDNGKIEIELPVEGSLDDPQIRSGAVVWKMVKQLILKVVKAPFKAIASLFGGSEELTYAAFEAGSASLGEVEKMKLAKTAELINKKEGLFVELEGFIDAAKDPKGYKELEFKRRVEAAKARELKMGKTAKVEPLEYEKYLKMAYDNEKFPKPKNLLGFEKSLSPADMKTLIISHIEAGKEQMEALAKKREEATREILIGYGVSPERLNASEQPLKAPTPKDKIPDSRVEIEFKNR